MGEKIYDLARGVVLEKCGKVKRKTERPYLYLTAGLFIGFFLGILTLTVFLKYL